MFCSTDFRRERYANYRCSYSYAFNTINDGVVYEMQRVGVENGTLNVPYELNVCVGTGGVHEDCTRLQPARFSSP